MPSGCHTGTAVDNCRDGGEYPCAPCATCTGPPSRTHRRPGDRRAPPAGGHRRPAPLRHDLDHAGPRDQPGDRQGARAGQRGQAARRHPRQAPAGPLPVPRGGGPGPALPGPVGVDPRRGAGGLAVAPGPADPQPGGDHPDLRRPARPGDLDRGHPRPQPAGRSARARPGGGQVDPRPALPGVDRPRVRRHPPGPPEASGQRPGQLAGGGTEGRGATPPWSRDPRSGRATWTGGGWARPATTRWSG